MIYVLSGGGALGAQKKGTIVVNYPIGATCTVTNGIKTYTALDTSGAAAFVVEPGTGTVRAYGADGDTSQSVTVTAGGWVEVELKFNLIIFASGRGAFLPLIATNNINGSWSITDEFIRLSKTQNDYGTADCVTENAIDVTKYATIYFEANCTAQYNGGVDMWARTVGAYPDATQGAAGNSGTAYVRLVANSTRQVYSVDISSLSGSYYIGTKGIGTADIYNIWLE